MIRICGALGMQDLITVGMKKLGVLILLRLTFGTRDTTKNQAQDSSEVERYETCLKVLLGQSLQADEAGRLQRKISACAARDSCAAGAQQAAEQALPCVWGVPRHARLFIASRVPLLFSFIFTQAQTGTIGDRGTCSQQAQLFYEHCFLVTASNSKQAIVYNRQKHSIRTACTTSLWQASQKSIGTCKKIQLTLLTCCEALVHSAAVIRVPSALLLLDAGSAPSVHGSKPEIPASKSLSAGALAARLLRNLCHQACLHHFGPARTMQMSWDYKTL